MDDGYSVFDGKSNTNAFSAAFLQLVDSPTKTLKQDEVYWT